MGLFIKKETRSMSTDLSSIPEFINLSGNYTSAKAIENADVFTAIQMIASDIASLPLQKHLHGVLEHHNELSKLFNSKPNDFYNAYQLKFIMVANALLSGESFIEIIRDKQGEPINLYHVKNSDITYKQDKTTQFKLAYDISESSGKIRRVKADNILHIKFFSLDGVSGISPLTTLKEDLNTQKSSKKLLSNFFKNGTHSGGYLKYKGSKLSGEARKNIRDEWQKANAGTDEANKVIILDETMDFEQIQVDTEILKLVNTSNHSTEQVAKAFKIPRHRFGLETSNMNLEAMNMDYLISTLQPYLESISNEINFKLVDDSAIDFVRYHFNTDNYKTIDSETKVKNVRSQLEMGVINLNEARREFGLEALDGDMGEKHLVSLNYTTLNNLEELQLSKAKNLPIQAVKDEDDSLKVGDKNDE